MPRHGTCVESGWECKVTCTEYYQEDDCWKLLELCEVNEVSGDLGRQPGGGEP